MIIGRPPTIVAIVMDNGERIDLDRLRGVWIGTPQSLKLDRLQAYVGKLAREWMAHEAGLDLVTLDALLSIQNEKKRNELLARFKGKDARNTQAQLAAITRARVIAAAESLRAKHTPEHKVRAEAAKIVRISRARVDQILGPVKKMKARK